MKARFTLQLSHEGESGGARHLLYAADRQERAHEHIFCN